MKHTASRLLALLLAVMMMASLAACGDDVTTDEVRGEQNVVDLPTTPSLNIPSEVLPDQSTPSSDKEFGLGQTSGLNYENKFIGIGCNLDSSWSFYTDAQIRELNQQAASIAGEEYNELMKNAKLVYDMYAATADQTCTINVNLEKSTVAIVEATEITSVYESIQSTIKQGYENMGFSNITFNITTATLDGKSVPVMKTTATVAGIPFYMMSVSLKCDAGYMASISIGTLQTDATDALLGKFYWTE